jgi:hypothetical protein
LHERFQLIAPEIREDVIPDFVSRCLPDIQRHDSVSALKQAEAYPTVSIEILCD